MKPVDMTGFRYGKLLVIRKIERGEKLSLPYIGQTGDLSALWLCRCDCGAEILSRRKKLRIGVTRSCGCAARENSRASLKARGFLPRGSQARVRQKMYLCRSKALRRGEVFSVTEREFEQLHDAACSFCGTRPAFGISRIQTKSGYVASNLVSCCATCNHAKNSLDLEDFKNHVLRIARHLGKG